MSTDASTTNPPNKPSLATNTPVKPSPTAKTKPNRLPAPTLFVGPPSRNASQLSISRTITHDPTIKPTRDPLIRTKSALRQPFNPISDASAAKDADFAGPDISITSPTSETDDARNSNNNPNANLLTSSQPSNPQSNLPPPTARKPSERSLDTKWRQLQNTLNEVELTAQQSTTHVFGESHASALSALRAAQVELARAWGRSSSSSSNNGQQPPSPSSPQTPNPLTTPSDLGLDRTKPRRRATTTSSSSSSSTSASTALSDESTSTLTTEAAGGSAGGERRGKGKGAVRDAFLEDETAMDVRLASERRAANEAYFSLVDGGVQEVVAKLGAVALAMKGMEAETRSLWSVSTGEREGEGEGEGGEGRGGEGRG